MKLLQFLGTDIIDFSIYTKAIELVLLAVIVVLLAITLSRKREQINT